jgi:hypothetical protein
MSNTLAEQLQHDFQQSTNLCRNEHEEWLMTHEQFATHALTLTFDVTRLWRALNKTGTPTALHQPEVVAVLHDSMRQFKWKLKKSLYGNLNGKILFVPVLEGLRSGQNPHYHCLLGVDPTRFDVVEAKVKAAWTEVPFGGQQIVVDAYRDCGWVSYTTKNAIFANRESINWMNVLLPTQSQSSAV